MGENRRHFIGLLFAALVAACGSVDVTDKGEDDVAPNDATPFCDAGLVQKIHGGAPLEDWLSTVRVISTESYCTGVMMDPYTVVTAAHCMEVSAERGHTGNVWTTQTGFRSHRIVHFEMLERDGHLDDIAVLWVDGTLPGPFPAGVFDPSMACTGLLAHGLGESEDGTKQFRELSMSVERYDDRTLWTASNEDGSGLCIGDSGGPLYAFVGGDVYLAGIASAKRGPCDAGKAVHVNAAGYVDFIQ